MPTDNQRKKSPARKRKAASVVEAVAGVPLKKFKVTVLKPQNLNIIKQEKMEKVPTKKVRVSRELTHRPQDPNMKNQEKQEVPLNKVTVSRELTREPQNPKMKNQEKKDVPLNKVTVSRELTREPRNPKMKNQEKKEGAPKKFTVSLKEVVKPEDSNTINNTKKANVGVVSPNGILTDTSFATLSRKVSKLTLKAIKEMGFEKMTVIQDQCIPRLLEGHDLFGKAKTGSGKTLAFLIPAIEVLCKENFAPDQGTGVIIISPTRELTLQSLGVLKQLLKYHTLTWGLVMGGTNKNKEVAQLEKGANILLATPGRLLDHLRNTSNFLFENLRCLVIDEGDRILDQGFQREMDQIIHILPKKRQTMLFSATCSPKMNVLSRMALSEEPAFVGVEEEKKATVEGLEQGVIECPTEQRLILLATLIRRYRHKKMMVFFSSCKSVKFHHVLFAAMKLDVTCIHGRMAQNKRTEAFFNFCRAGSAVLLCTSVAARGLDIPDVDCIVQFDAPDDEAEYIHRVGRTARGHDGKGSALLVLRPEEMAFVQHLQSAKISLNQVAFPCSEVVDTQQQMEKMITSNTDLHLKAVKAFTAYVRTYTSRKLKKFFNISALNLELLALSFGLKKPPTKSSLRQLAAQTK